MNVQDTHFYEEFYSFNSSYKFKTIEQVQADENIRFSLFLKKERHWLGDYCLTSQFYFMKSYPTLCSMNYKKRIVFA